MAASKLVLCDLLCFVLSNFDRVPTKPLKGAIVDFYSAEEISNAKLTLLENVKLLELSIKLPHIPRRREGEGFFIKEIDDLFALLYFLDDNKLFGSSPKFVTSNPNNIPSSRLFEGDMKCWVDRLDTGVNLCALLLAASQTDDCLLYRLISMALLFEIDNVLTALMFYYCISNGLRQVIYLSSIKICGEGMQLLHEGDPARSTALVAVNGADVSLQPGEQQSRLLQLSVVWCPSVDYQEVPTGPKHRRLYRSAS
jgi:hypothetical protein